MDRKELDVWKKNLKLVETIFKISVEFPSFRIYGLTIQIRRATVSILSNLAEGPSRNSDRELL